METNQKQQTERPLEVVDLTKSNNARQASTGYRSRDRYPSQWLPYPVYRAVMGINNIIDVVDKLGLVLKRSSEQHS